jgi:GR25 family glycosyltransferase involved in LPS biosynthesis
MTRFYCISLWKRLDRRENMDLIFTKLGINDQVQYLLVEPHPDGGILGCFESHIIIWNEIAKSKMKDEELIVIFEDDLMLTRNISPEEFRNLLEAVSQLLKSSYDIFQFGRDIRSINDKIGGFDNWTFWAGRCKFTHFYGITAGSIRRNINKIRRNFGKHIDEVFRDNLSQLFIVPNVFCQRNLHDSDVSWGLGGSDQFFRILTIFKNKYLETYLFNVKYPFDYFSFKLKSFI